MAYGRRYRKRRMPYSNNLSKNRRYYKKKVKRNRPGVVVNKSSSMLSKGITVGFPDNLLMKIRFTDSAGVVGGTINGQVTYALNGLYDPRISVGGTQPAYFDNMMSVYRSYVVYACAYRVIYNVKDNSAITVICATLPVAYNTTATAPTIQDIYTNDASQWNLLSLPAGGHNFCTHNGFVKIKALEGFNPFTDITYHGTSTSNPARTPYLALYAQSYDNATVCNVFAQIQLTYYVKFYEKYPTIQN